MPMNVLPRSIERGSVTLFSASVVLIFLRFQDTQNLGLYTYYSLSEQSRDITMWLYTDTKTPKDKFEELIFNKLLLDFIIKNNISFKAVSSRSFRALLEYLNK